MNLGEQPGRVAAQPDLCRQRQDHGAEILRLVAGVDRDAATQPAGNDADAVYRIAQIALAKARAGDGPSLIEAKTYRHSGHSRADPGAYRPDAEVEEWLARGPIPSYRERLLAFGIPEGVVQGIDDEVRRAVEIRVRYLDYENEIRELEADGLLSTCTQHEMDHLDGILFVDYLSMIKRGIILRKMQKLRKAEAVGA